jgi:hypothetical protein
MGNKNLRFWQIMPLLIIQYVVKKTRKIGGFFKVNCGVMDGDLRKYRKHYD